MLRQPPGHLHPRDHARVPDTGGSARLLHPAIGTIPATATSAGSTGGWSTKAPRRHGANGPTGTKPWSDLIRAESNAILGERGMWSGRVNIEPRERAAAPFHMPGPLNRAIEDSPRVMANESLWFDHELHLGELHLYGIYGARQEWCRSRSNRKCADEARSAIKAMTADNEIECTWPEEARFKQSWRLRAVCTTAEHREREQAGECEGIECSLNWELVRKGWAVQIHYPRRRSNDRILHQLLRAEHAARDERAGIWTGRVKLSDYVKGLRKLRSTRRR